MCGITGIVGAKDLNWVKLSLKFQEFRGPEFSSIVECDKAILGHNRLVIKDVSNSANQPFKDDRYVLVFNGEIYNQNELLKYLRQSYGSIFVTTSDTELLFEGLRLEGVSFIDRLEGMYAFAFYDTESGDMLLSRDKFGEKPLYYSIINKVLKFSSNLDAFTIDNPALCSKAVSQYFNLGLIETGRTIYKGVREVNPSSSIIFQDGQCRLHCTNPIAKDKSIEDDLVQSINLQYLHADVPLTLLLSGGLDSSLLVALLSRGKAKISTFTVAMPKKSDKDESEFAKKIASEYQSHHTEVPFNSLDLDVARKILSSCDEPLNDSSQLGVYLLTQGLRKQRIKVGIGGDGADELYFGYKHYTRLWFLSLVYKLVGLNYTLKLVVLAKRTNPKLVRYESFLLNWSKDKFLPISHKPSPLNICEFITLSGLDELTLFEKKTENFVEAQNHYDLSQYLVNDILKKSDRMSMLNSVELRAPFLSNMSFQNASRGLIQFNGVRKKILREFASKKLPKWFDLSRKQGFLIPFDSWLENSEFNKVIWNDITNCDIYDSQRLLKNANEFDIEFVFGLWAFALWYNNRKDNFNPNNSTIKKS